MHRSVAGLLALTGFALQSAVAQQWYPSPLVAHALEKAEKNVLRVVLDGIAVDMLRPEREAVIKGLPLSPTREIDLTLARFEVLTENALVLHHDGEQNNPVPRPDVQTWRGSVVGEPESYAYLALTPNAAYGYVSTEGSVWVISSAFDANGVAQTIVFPAERISDPVQAVCAGEVLVPDEFVPVQGPARETYGPRSYSCRVYNIAVDTDREFTSNRFGGNENNAQAYALVLMGPTSEIYQRDMNLVLKVGFLRTWGGTSPYDASNTSTQLNQFRNYWISNHTDTVRDTAHLLSARSLGGGIAYKPGLCTNNYGYGVSANLNGTFPFPIRDNHSSNWDLMVVAHELGHNFSSGHTHDLGSYNPIIDGCGSEPRDCTVAAQRNGTIMSYCHTCSGGMANMKMTFGPRPIESIRTWIDGRTWCGTSQTSIAVTNITQNTTICINERVIVTVTATGSNRRYQWYKNGVLIPGATGGLYIIQSAQPSDQGQYSCVVSNDCSSAGSTHLSGGYLTVQDGVDCNGNGIPDICDIRVGYSADTNGNGIPDECEVPCPADFNGDGGVDGADVEAFFTAWTNAEESADVNEDGGVDGADVETFFSYWEAGAC